MIFVNSILVCHNASPEKKEKSIDLQHNTYDGPSDEHHKHSSQKETSGFHFMPLEKESKCPFQSDNKRQTCNKQDLQTEREREREYIRTKEFVKILNLSNYTHLYCVCTHISNGQESFIKEQNHPKEEEKHTEARQAHPNLCSNTQKLLL